MRIGIGRVTKELGIKPHMLHKWEERGWLGYEPVLKDPEANNQRVYSKEQLERIRFIHGLIEDQRERGNKRTDFSEVEKALLETFGGELIPVKEETSLLPSTVDEFHHLMLQNNKMLGEMMDEHRKAQEAMSKKLDDVLLRFEETESEKEKLENELRLLKDKLDIAVDYIQKQEQEEKKGFWKKLFG